MICRTHKSDDMTDKSILPKEVKKFASPISIKDCDLCSCIEEALNDSRKKGGCYNSILEEVTDITDTVYEKKAHNGSNSVNKHKCKKIEKYTERLNEIGLSDDQRNFILKTYFDKTPQFETPLKKGYITNEIAAWLWCYYACYPDKQHPEKKHSLAFYYEQNLRKRIEDYARKLL